MRSGELPSCWLKVSNLPKSAENPSSVVVRVAGPWYGESAKQRIRAMTESLLDEQARQALLSAYAPYSCLRVGAAVRSAAGHIYCGCNVECASFPIGGCAERAAIAAAVLAEGPSLELVEVSICALDDNDFEQMIPPCGACRQLILELGPNAQVRFLGHGHQWQSVAITALLPHAFKLSR